MSCNDYEPRPIHTSKVRPPREVAESREKLASPTRSIWAQSRMADGWRWGATRDEARKLQPCLIPYEELPESEKNI
jgi:hypothetical protein